MAEILRPLANLSSVPGQQREMSTILILRDGPEGVGKRRALPQEACSYYYPLEVHWQ